MAQANFTPIQLYYSTTASAAPTSGNLANGELAINITDGKLFYKDNGGVVQTLAVKMPSGVLPTTNGGTGLSSYTTGDIVYSSATNTLAKLGIGSSATVLTSSGTAPQWTAQSSLAVGRATNLAGGAANQIPAQSGANTTTFIAAPTTATTFLMWNGSAFTWSNVSPSGSTFATDILVNGLTVGRGSNNVSTNTTFGVLANNSATSNSVQQTAVGLSALADCISTGTVTPGEFYDGNTAVGCYSLKDLISGGKNTAMGAGSLYKQTSGDDNTAIGAGAGYNITTGSGSTLVGSFAGFGVSTGSVVAVGLNAIPGGSFGASVTSTNTVAVGNSALFALTTGSGNTAIGASALLGINDSNNTAIGYLAGSNSVTGSNNVMLGWNAQASSNTASNQITLGNSSITTLRCQVTSITSLSDQRDKYDIEDLPVGLNLIKQLRPRRFKWDKRDWYVDEVEREDGTTYMVDVPKDGSRAKADWNEGFIAQEAKAALQSLGAEWFPLIYEDNAEKLEMSSGKLIPVLVKAIQELTARIEALEAK